MKKYFVMISVLLYKIQGLLKLQTEFKAPMHNHSDHNNFIKITEHLTSSMCGQSMKRRNISSTTTNHNGNGKRHKSDNGGCSRGNGPNGGNSGQNSSSGGNSGEGSSEKAYDGVIEPKHYPKHIYKTFTPEQKQRHRALWQQQKQNRNVSATKSADNGKEEPKGTGIGNQSRSAAHF